MLLSRRGLLQASLLAAMPRLLWARQADDLLRQYRLEDGSQSALFQRGDSLLVDTSRQAFSAAGIYLYPAWGRPRAYHVQRNGDWLEFRSAPGSSLLWRQRHAAGPEFAGLVLGPLRAGLQPVVAPLQVPALPASG